MILITGGHILDPASGTDAISDVLIDGNRIARIAPGISAPDAEVLNAAGSIVAPGFIDLHCHLPSARTRPGNFRNHRNGNTRGCRRRIHGCLLHAEYAACE